MGGREGGNERTGAMLDMLDTSPFPSPRPPHLRGGKRRQIIQPRWIPPRGWWGRGLPQPAAVLLSPLRVRGEIDEVLRDRRVVLHPT